MSPMAQLYLRNAKKVECASAFPPTAFPDSENLQDRVKRFRSSYLYAPLADRPIRFNGPETVADVPVAGYLEPPRRHREFCTEQIFIDLDFGNRLRKSL
jgi:hypothetical protein